MPSTIADAHRVGAGLPGRTWGPSSGPGVLGNRLTHHASLDMYPFAAVVQPPYNRWVSDHGLTGASTIKSCMHARLPHGCRDGSANTESGCCRAAACAMEPELLSDLCRLRRHQSAVSPQTSTGSPSCWARPDSNIPITTSPPDVWHPQPRRIVHHTHARTRDIVGLLDALALPPGHLVSRDCPVFGPERTEHRAVQWLQEIRQPGGLKCSLMRNRSAVLRTA